MQKTKLLLFTILILSALLRIWGLNRVPPELFGDELDAGYHAFSLLKTGKDYYGNFLPTYIHSFSEWRAPLLMYVTTPFVWLFGLNEWGVRLPSAVFGVLSIFLLYKITKLLFDREDVALASSLIMTVIPWHLQYSRAAFEVSLLLFLILSGTLLFLYSLKKPVYLLFSALAFGLTFYTYSTANLFTPMYIFVLMVTNRGNMKALAKKHILAGALIFTLVIIPIANSVIFGYAGERFTKFSIFNDDTIVSDITIKRLEGKGTLAETIFHNRPLYWGKRMIINYATSFSPQFLFVDGDITFRHSIHEVGEFYWILLPFFLTGFYLFVRKAKPEYLFVLLWIAIAPIPSSLTRDGAVHATRLVLMLPPMVIIAGGGFVSLFEYFRKIKKGSPFVALVTVIFLIEFVLYQHRYWIHYPIESWRWWHTGYKEALQYMKSEDANYNQVVFNNTYEPTLIRFLFWWQYSPKVFLNQFTNDKEQKDILPGFNGFELGDKYFFGSAKDTPGGVIGFIEKDMLYLVSQRDEVGGDWDWEVNPPGGLKVLKTVRNPYHEPIFYVVTRI